MLRQVILDTETTGLDVTTGHRIIEIGCVELISRKFTGKEFQTYLNPGRSVDEGAEKVHGLSNEFLGDKPEFNEIADEFLDFIQGSELLIHNANFDLGFINYELQLLKGEKSSLSDYVDKVIDTLDLARKKHPGQRNSLDALVQRYNITGYDRHYHGALIDSKILGDVYLALTGGQSDIKFESNKVVEAEEDGLIASQIPLHDKKRSTLIELTEEEEQLHLDYLQNMHKEFQIESFSEKD